MLQAEHLVYLVVVNVLGLETSVGNGLGGGKGKSHGNGRSRPEKRGASHPRDGIRRSDRELDRFASCIGNACGGESVGCEHLQPKPIIPVCYALRMRAIGASPFSAANSREASTRAAAPSFNEDALAAVTVPSDKERRGMVKRKKKNLCRTLASAQPPSLTLCERRPQPGHLVQLDLLVLFVLIHDYVTFATRHGYRGDLLYEKSVLIVDVR